MRKWMKVVAGAALLSAACGRPFEPGKADGAGEVADAGPGWVDAGIPDAGVVAHFDAEAIPTGAAIWLKADLSAPSAPRLEVWTQGVGPVLGLAFHLVVDGAQLRIDSAGAEPAMGLDARYLQRVRGPRVAFGLAHLGSASGETDLTAPTRVAVVQLTALSAVDSKISLERVQARRADGAFVAVGLASGRLLLPGGAQ